MNRYFNDVDQVEIKPVFYDGRGCSHCRNTGYHGRVAFYEMALITDKMGVLINRAFSDAELAEAAAKVGYRPLRYDGLKQVLLGHTITEELEKYAAFDWVS
ncbi:MAG: hypothetical protein ACN4GF_06055 [Lentimonas sp.]